MDAIRHIGEEMHKSGSSWLDLADPLAMSNFCKKHGLDLEEVKDNLPKIVEKLKEHGLHLSDLPMDIDDKVKQKDELVTGVGKLKDELTGLDKKKVQKLKEAGHTEESIARCVELSDFLTKYGLSPDAPDKLKNAISNAEADKFDGVAIAKKVSTVENLESTKTNLEKNIKTLESEKEKAGTDVQDQRIDHWKDMEAIRALRVLKEKGAENSDILAMKDIVEKEGSDLPALRDKAARQGGLDKTIQESETKVNELGTRKLELEPAVNLLEQRKKALETVLNNYDENIKKKMEAITDAASDVVTKISDAGKETSTKIAAIGTEAEEVTKRFAQSRGLLAFEPLIRSLNGEKVDVRQERDATVLAMTILSADLSESSKSKNSLDVVIKYLKEDSSINYPL